MMTIKIKENKARHILIDLHWTSRFAYEHERILIIKYPIGKTYETIAKKLVELLKKKESEGRMRF